MRKSSEPAKACLDGNSTACPGFLSSELLKVSDKCFIKHTNTFGFQFLSNSAAGGIQWHKNP